MTKNKFFDDEFVSEDDLFYTCFITLSQKTHNL